MYLLAKILCRRHAFAYPLTTDYKDKYDTLSKPHFHITNMSVFIPLRSIRDFKIFVHFSFLLLGLGQVFRAKYICLFLLFHLTNNYIKLNVSTCELHSSRV